MAQAESDPERRTTTLAADATASVENAPVPGPKWERHDRTHLELTLRYPVSEDRTWQAFYFLPESFRLDANTYSKRELFVDFRSYVRFTIPRIELERVPEEARKLAGRLTSGTPDDVVRELKLFSCRVRLAITDEAQAIIDTAGPDGGRRGTAVVDAFVTTGSAALAAIRDVLEPLGQADPEVAKTAAWVDEYLSRILEMALIDLANVVGAGDGSEGVLGATTAAAVDEARYRRSRNAGPVSSATGSIHDLEQIERRQHSLKRFTSSVLWLDVQIRDGYSVALHIFHALAAGIAMAFAVVLAVLFGQPNVPGRLGVWVAVVIVAYMGKDRLKAILQTVFDSLVATHLPDRRWTVNRPDSSSVLGDVAERLGFVDREALPDGVDVMRRVAFRNRLQELG